MVIVILFFPHSLDSFAALLYCAPHGWRKHTRAVHTLICTYHVYVHSEKQQTTAKKSIHSE